MQVRFDLMVDLAAIDSAFVYDGGLVLTSLDMALIPCSYSSTPTATGQETKSIQWHIVWQE
jgi:hypothetical protein